ncbi:ABC transporter G family member 42-like [Elaeis guineensis]|uniref:ABC transporter G family member 42-like n=1 Tax=Elaeis guineensis var. tenera TaxID=51953 RepID=UPI003C6CD313
MESMERVWDSGRRASRNLSRSIGRNMNMGNWGMEDVFARSSTSRRSRGGSRRGIDDDEEALRWAALEKLPTYNRLRTGILKTVVEGGEHGGGRSYEHKEVDVRKLGLNERQEFIERIFKVAEEDNERFLKKLRNRIDKVGIQLPTVEVRFENLTVEAKCHIGNRALPTLLNSARNIVESAVGLLGIRLAKRATLTILKDASGIIQPSRMTLLLGPPSSGKTTLLLALAGKLDPTLKTRGEVTYNGYRLDEFVAQKTAAYISQNDVHVGEMTVKETLDFSARCQGVGARYELLTELAQREKVAGIFPEAEVDLFMKATAMEGVKSSLQTDYTLRILGLDICADTIVGDEMQRGISGGQKKRVTTGEMIVGPTKVLFMDEISTGLDSSTTFQMADKGKQSLVRHFGPRAVPKEGHTISWLLVAFYLSYFLMSYTAIECSYSYMPNTFTKAQRIINLWEKFCQTRGEWKSMVFSSLLKM